MTTIFYVQRVELVSLGELVELRACRVQNAVPFHLFTLLSDLKRMHCLAKAAQKFENRNTT